MKRSWKYQIASVLAVLGVCAAIFLLFVSLFSTEIEVSYALIGACALSLASAFFLYFSEKKTTEPVSKKPLYTEYIAFLAVSDPDEPSKKKAEMCIPTTDEDEAFRYLADGRNQLWRFEWFGGFSLKVYRWNETTKTWGRVLYAD